MTDFNRDNPYAAPGAELVLPPIMTGAWSSGKHLVVPKGWVSPPVCLFTGAAGPLTPLRQGRLSYLQPAWLLLLLLSPLVLIIVGLFVTKKGNIHYVLEQEYARLRKRRLWGNWMIFVSGVLLIFLGANLDEGALAVLGIVFIIVSAFLGVTWCRLLKTAKITDDSIWLAGIPAGTQEVIIRWEQQKLARKLADLPASGS